MAAATLGRASPPRACRQREQNVSLIVCNVEATDARAPAPVARSDYGRTPALPTPTPALPQSGYGPPSEGPRVPRRVAWRSRTRRAPAVYPCATFSGSDSSLLRAARRIRIYTYRWGRRAPQILPSARSASRVSLNMRRSSHRRGESTDVDAANAPPLPPPVSSLFTVGTRRRPDSAVPHPIGMREGESGCGERRTSETNRSYPALAFVFPVHLSTQRARNRSEGRRPGPLLLRHVWSPVHRPPTTPILALPYRERQRSALNAVSSRGRSANVERAHISGDEPDTESR